MTPMFDLPEDYLCHIVGYNRTGSFLEIKVYPETGTANTQYIQFEGVVYFDGPVFWKGTAFQRRTDTDCLALLRDLHVHNELPGDTLVGQFGLYSVPMTGTGREVRVLAIRAAISPQPSGRFP